MNPLRNTLRRFGGLAGIAIAFSSGLGIAVGTYSLPDPQNASVSHSAYARADQRGIAVWKTESATEFKELRIEVTRGASAGGNADASSRSQSTDTERDANVWLRATLRTCPSRESEECSERKWDSAMPLDAFTFDPAMESARFNGVVAGCEFDVSWTASGNPAPFEQRASEFHLGDSGLNGKAEGFAEISRVAPARITSCVGSVERTPGFLSVGLRRYFVGRETVAW